MQRPSTTLLCYPSEPSKFAQSPTTPSPCCSCNPPLAPLPGHAATGFMLMCDVVFRTSRCSKPPAAPPPIPKPHNTSLTTRPSTAFGQFSRAFTLKRGIDCILMILGNGGVQNPSLSKRGGCTKPSFTQHENPRDDVSCLCSAAEASRINAGHWPKLKISNFYIEV